MTLDTKPLEQALRRLEPEQGPRARRNARAAVKTALRKLVAAMDKEYPPPPRKHKGGKRRASPAKRLATLLRSGWREVALAQCVAQLRQAGTATKVIDVDGIVKTLARQWAVIIWRERGVTVLKEAVRSPRRRAEILGELKLAGKIP